ncbi:MAG: type IV secretory system conjugative DNA transfer family protein [Acidimicrobiales bacterium]
MSHDRPIIGRRLWRGLSFGVDVALAERQSMLVVGPTQSGKTSALVVPSLLRWRGPAVVTSVKGDVLFSTASWRARVGRVQVLEPGRDDGLTWDPLEGVTTIRHALRVARDLTSPPAGRSDTEFWNALATKLVASLFVRAIEEGRTVFDVAAAVEDRRFDEWVEGGGAASDILRSFLAHEARTLDGVATTAETMLLPWRFAQPLAGVRGVVDGAHTLYLCAPRGELSHFEPLFRGALRTVLEEQQRLAEVGRARRLLLLLDEAMAVAPLDDLDHLAATLAGLGVTLVTVVQDFAQISARFGRRASTIVNNHATRVVVAGVADPAVKTFLPEIVEGAWATPVLRMRTPGTALVVAGSRPVVAVRLRPWWRSRRLRRRGERERSLRFADGERG